MSGAAGDGMGGAGTLLGGRVRYLQPRSGHRSGIEPVLLAAGVPARAGERVIEAGCGAGAGLLCLAARVPGLAGLGVERDEATAGLARHNLAANGMAGIGITTGDILRLGIGAGFHHGFANPPWHEADGTASPDEAREAARRGREGLVHAWVAALAALLRPRGTLTLVLPSGRFAECCAAFAEAGVGAVALLPLWPRAGRPARLVLVQGRRGARGPARVLPGLVLHGAGSLYTAEAEAILREGAALAW